MSDNPLDHLCTYCGDAFDDEDSENPPVLVPADDEVDNGQAWAHTLCAIAAGDLDAEPPPESLINRLAQELDLAPETVKRSLRRLIERGLVEELVVAAPGDVNPYSRPAPCDVCGQPGRFRGMDGRGDDVIDLALCDPHAEARGLADGPTIIGADLATGEDMTLTHQFARAEVARMFGVPLNLLGPTRVVPLSDEGETLRFSLGSLLEGDGAGRPLGILKPSEARSLEDLAADHPPPEADAGFVVPPCEVCGAGPADGCLRDVDDASQRTESGGPVPPCPFEGPRDRPTGLDLEF